MIIFFHFFRYRKLEELQAALSDSTQKIGKLNETIEAAVEEKKKELDSLLEKHQGELKASQDKIDDAVCTLA